MSASYSTVQRVYKCCSWLPCKCGSTNTEVACWARCITYVTSSMYDPSMCSQGHMWRGEYMDVTKGCPQWLIHTVNRCSSTDVSDTGHKIRCSNCLWTHKTTAIENKTKFAVCIKCLEVYLHGVHVASQILCQWSVCLAHRPSLQKKSMPFDSWCKSYSCNKLATSLDTKQILLKNCTSLQSTSSLLLIYNIVKSWTPSTNTKQQYKWHALTALPLLLCGRRRRSRAGLPPSQLHLHLCWLK